MTLPLFERYPQIQASIPVVSLAQLPTPVEAMPGLSESAWIKRDDLTHSEYGGNKIRKLEFILGDAIKRGKNHVFTFGAIGTNHGVATAMACQQFGLRCTVLLFDQPVTPTVHKNLQLMAHYGAELVYCRSLAHTVLRYYAHPARLSSTSYFLFAGGSNPAGTLGFVNAAFELKGQIERGECPEPDEIIVPVGSSATLAGLTIGLSLAELGSKVRGIRVAPSHLGPFPACTPATVSHLMKKTCRLFQQFGIKLGSVPEPILDDSFYGEGYGVATREGEKAASRLEEQGIAMEQTYTAKAAAAFLEALSKETKQVLYWHTFNSRPMPATLERDTGVCSEILRQVEPEMLS